MMDKPQTGDVIAKASTAMVSKTIGKRGSEGGEPETATSEDIIAIHKFVTNPAMVSVGVALTMNLGNFEFAKIDIQMTLPCYKEEADDAFAFVQNWVEQKVQQERELINAHRDKSQKLNPL